MGISVVGWFLSQKASDTEIWYVYISLRKTLNKQSSFWDAMTPMSYPCYVTNKSILYFLSIKTWFQWLNITKAPFVNFSVRESFLMFS